MSKLRRADLRIKYTYIDILRSLERILKGSKVPSHGHALVHMCLYVCKLNKKHTVMYASLLCLLVDFPPICTLINAHAQIGIN